MGDILGQIMRRQEEFQIQMYPKFRAMSDQEAVAYIKEHSIHLTQELHEMLYELPYFKPWKDYSKMTYQEVDIAFKKARAEYIDMLHFFINIGIALNFTASDIHEMYHAKHDENRARQEDGYTHDKSYRGPAPFDAAAHGQMIREGIKSNAQNRS
jgi:hypothetical protein